MAAENRDGSTGQSRSSLGASRRASSYRLSPITPSRSHRFSAGPRARDGSAERIKCNSEEAVLDPEKTGLTDPELSDSCRSLLDYSAITRRVAIIPCWLTTNRYLTNI